MYVYIYIYIWSPPMIYLETFYTEITMLFCICIYIYIYIHDKDINYNSWIFFVDDSLGFNANWISSQYLKTMYPLVICYIAVENCHL